MLLQNKLSEILTTVPTTAAIPRVSEKKAFNAGVHVNSAPPSVVLYTSMLPFPVPPLLSIA